MKNNTYVSSSRRTPWEDKEYLSPLELFIHDEYHDHYDIHHNTSLTIEADLLNSIEITECRLCGSINISKN